MQELIERLEKADGPNFALEQDIWRAVFAPEATFPNMKPPAFTCSIDAAMKLAPDGWSVHIDFSPRNVGNYARVYNDGMIDEPFEFYHGNKPPAIALCIAALKARAVSANKGSDG